MFKRIGLILLFTALALGSELNFCSIERGDSRIMVLLPGDVFATQVLCIGTQQQMDAGIGIDCYESIPFPAPNELRTPRLPARVSFPPIPGQP